MQRSGIAALRRIACVVAGLALLPSAVLAATYTWNAASGSFTDASSWSPLRSAPAVTDVLLFDGSVTPTAAVTGLVTQTIAQLVVQNGAAVTFASPASATLTIAGDAGADFDVNGATLTTLAGNVIILAIGAGATGTVRNAGVVALQGGGHRVLPADADALHFQSGGKFVSDVGMTGNPFGNAGTANVVVFETTSAFVFRAGANPFGLLQPASRVTFQAGSLYRHESVNQPSLAGRTYADIEWDNGPTTLTASSGTAPWSADHLHLVSGVLNVTAALPLTVRNDLDVSAGATFNYSPSVTPATLTLGGTGAQSISSTNDAAAGTGNLTLGPLANVVVGGASAPVVAAGDLVVQGSLSFPGKLSCAGASRVVMAPGSVLTPSAGWVDGPLALSVPAGSPSLNFPVGDAAGPSPVNLSFASVGSSGSVVVRASAGDHPLLVGSGLNAARSVNRWWRVGPVGGAMPPPLFTTCDATLNFTPGDLDPGTVPASLIVGKFDTPTWTLPTFAFGPPWSIVATGLSSFSDFAVAEASSCPAIAVAPATLGPGNSGSPFAATLTASGGTAPYTFAVVIGSLPPGLSLAPGGALTGTPTTAGSYAFTVAATDAGACGGTRSYSFVVNGPCPAISVAPPTLPDGLISTAYGQSVTASGGTAPYTFAITAGAAPTRLGLSPAGVLSGTCSALGVFGFDVTATDANGCTATLAYSVTVGCPIIAVFPSVLLGATAGVPFSASCAGGGGTAPYSFAVTSGSLPPGLSLAPGGALTGTPGASGSFPFTITATDADGCTGNRAYAMGVAPGDVVSVGPAPSCISSAHPCVVVPVNFTRFDPTPMRAYSITVQLSPELAACGPQFTSAGFLPPGSGGTFFFVTPGAPGQYVVDESTLGEPCGVTGSGTLFNISLTSSAPSYTSGAVTVTSVTVRDCANAPLPGVPGSGATLTIDWTGPGAIADLAAAQHKTGNDADGTTKIGLTFTPPGDAASVEVWRHPFGGYPQYDENGGAVPALPASPTSAALAGWTLTPVTASGQSDEPAARDFWYYVAFSTDACGNVSAVSNRTNGTLDYHLGDVADGFTACAGENAVTIADLTLLGANYHLHPPVNGALECLDVGPTTDYSVNARPTTDNFLDFEDLMLYSINFAQVSSPSLAAAPAREDGAGASAVWIEAPKLAAAGARLQAFVRVRGEGDLQGVSARLRWDAGVVRPVGFASGGWLESQGGVVFGAGEGGVDGALLGVGARGMSGEGALAVVEFEALREGDPGISLARAEGRDADNRRVALAGASAESGPSPPARTSLGPAFPNLFRGTTSLRLALAHGSAVKLAVYDLGGRRVRSLLDAELPAGERLVTWDGRDDAGLALAPGLYVVRFVASGDAQSHRVLLVR